jgi:hypothetical protein
LTAAGGALALAVALSAPAARAQYYGPPAATPSFTVAPAGPGTASAAAAAVQPTGGLEPGMVVRDASGALIGSVMQVGRTPAGVASVVVNLGGTLESVPSGTLSIVQPGNQVMSSQTREQILQSGQGLAVQPALQPTPQPALAPAQPASQ